ncbi:MAG TPA: EipA family protein [Steroidobacteraceae bacterium]|nr:EipA family protein [Steroidobacteraceae bacterium]
MLPNPSTKSCLALLLASLLLASGAATAAGQAAAAGASHATYSDEEVVKSANDFFKNGAEDLSKVLGKVLKEKGQPVAIIRGEEGGGAIGVGLRYGHGELVYKGSAGRKVYWQGPSIGFDIGANAVKVFALVYDLPSPDKLYQRFPGVEGSLYFVGGFGVNYVQSDHIVIAPVRFGVGWRLGIAVSYMHFSPEKRLNPF